jgi:hypothetical protein
MVMMLVFRKVVVVVVVVLFSPPVVLDRGVPHNSCLFKINQQKNSTAIGWLTGWLSR